MIDVIHRGGVTRAPWCIPTECSAAQRQIVRSADFLTIDNGTNGCRSAIIGDADILAGKWSFNAVGIQLVVHDAGVLDLSTAGGTALGVDDKEILERNVAVELIGEVRQVITEFHSLGVQLAICPAAKHRHLSVSAVTVIVSVVAVVFQHHRLIW